MDTEACLGDWTGRQVCIIIIPISPGSGPHTGHGGTDAAGSAGTAQAGLPGLVLAKLEFFPRS